MTDPAFPPTEPAPGHAPAPPPEPTHRLPIGTEIGGLRITGVIGEGGFGVVYLAFDPTLQRQVALKEYMPMTLASRARDSAEVTVRSERFVETFNAGLRSFVNEARLLAHFDHPALVKVHQFWQANRTAYMVMPYYEGPTLKAHVQRLAAQGRAPDEAQLRRWIDPLLDALELMHAENCCHRDIAPDNILLTARGPLLLDFGAARRVISDMTHALTVILKPGYAPIEQYGEAASMVQGPWTDLYALASVVYFAITGRSPITSVERLMGDPLPRLAEVAAGRYGDRFLRAIDAALSVRPQERPQSVGEFRALLAEAAEASAASAVTRAEPPIATPAMASERKVDRVPPLIAPSTPAAAWTPAAPSSPAAPAAAPASQPREAGRPAPQAKTPAPERRRLWIGVLAAVLVGAAGLAGILARGDRSTAADATASSAPADARSPGPSVAPDSGSTRAATDAPATPSAAAPSPDASVAPPVAVAPRATPAAVAGTQSPPTTTPAARSPSPVPAASARPAAPPTPAVPRPVPPATARVKGPATAAGTEAGIGTRATTLPKTDSASAPAIAAGTRPAPSAAADLARPATPTAPGRPARCDELLRKGSQQPLTVDEANFLRQACR